MNQCQLLCEFHCTHVKDNENYASKQYHVLNAPDIHSNQEVNVDVISNVMTFLTLGVKV